MPRALLGSLLVILGVAMASPTAAAPDGHVFEDVLVAMRDGAELAALVRRPADPSRVVPAVLIHTPYDKENVRRLWFEDSQGEPLFASPDYAFVVSDWRGRFGSGDAQLTSNGQHPEDGHDLVEWVAAQPWCDGNVGMYGPSALGRIQYSTAVEQPPHLRAAVPIFADMNHYYENYYPGGVLRREYLDAIGLLFGVNQLVRRHPTYDLVWFLAEHTYDPARVQVPMLVVSGWFDLYNVGTHRTFSELRATSDTSVRDRHRLLVGPWFHFASGGERIWGRDFTAEEMQWVDRDRVIQQAALAFLDLHLRGVDSDAASWSRVRYLPGRDPTWISVDEWPPPSSPRQLYLTRSGGLVEQAPGAGAVQLPYDPLDPSPTVGGQTLGWSYLHGPTDQTTVLARPDAAAFVTEPLTAALRIAGRIEVTLAMRTTGLDTDLVVRLTDVDEHGRHLLLTDGIRRLKLRDDLGTVSEVTPGERYTVPIVLTNELAYTFARDHRVGLIVSSSNYARFDRNPNTGDDFFEDAGVAMVVTNTILTDGEARLTLPVSSVAGGSPAPRRPSGRVRP